MSAVSDVLEYRLSGGAGNANPDSSLGGAASATEIVNSTKENLFSNVSSAEVNNGSKKYRCIYIYNKGTKKLSGLGAYIGSKTQSAYTSVAIGRGSSPVGTSGTEQSIANEDTEPTGVTFTSPTSSAAPLSLPELPVNNYLPIWIRRDTTVGADGAFDDYVRIMFDGVDNVDLKLPLMTSLDVEVGQGSVNFTRNSIGTYVDSSGILQTAAVDVPRFETNGLLVEGISTNLLTYSEQFDNAAWIKQRSTISINAMTAPDGTGTACKLVEDTQTGAHYIFQYVTVSDVGSVSGSFFVKAGERTKCRLYLYNVTDGVQSSTIFDLVTGTVVSGNGIISSLANGWHRVSVSADVTVTDDIQCRLLLYDGSSDVYTGDGSSGLFLFGGQIEELSFSSSYISTTVASAARAADACTIQFADNHQSIQAGNPFTLLIDADSHHVDAAERVILTAGFVESGVNRYSLLRVENNSTDVAYYRSGASIRFYGADLDSKMRYGITVDSTQLVTIYIDGSVAGAAAAFSLADDTGVDANSISIGCTVAGSYQLFGHVSNLAIYNYALSDYEMSIK